MFIIVDKHTRRVLAARTYKHFMGRWLPIWESQEHAQITIDLLDWPGTWEILYMDMQPDQIYHAIRPTLVGREQYVGYVVDPGLATEQIVPVREQLPLRA